MHLEQLVRRVRPAPLGAAIASVLQLNRRRQVDYQGMRFNVDPTSDLGLGIIGGAYEDPMMRTLERFLKPGGVFLDIGANEAFFSVAASRLVGPAGRVIAIEPQERLVPVILGNFSQNQCTNAELVNCVISDRVDEDATIFLSANTNTGSSSMFLLTKYKQKEQKTRSTTLAALIETRNLDRIDLVKIDVEGAEYEIITASRAALASGVIKAISLEYHPTILKARGLSMDDIHQVLLECGFELEPGGENSIYIKA
jgi:FkbM family methyltransferase